jgi:hypothetical protein
LTSCSTSIREPARRRSQVDAAGPGMQLKLVRLCCSPMSTTFSPVSTGHLPAAERLSALVAEAPLVAEAHERENGRVVKGQLTAK